MKYSLKDALEKVKMTLINVRVQDFTLTFDIDTGSTENIVFDYVSNQLPNVFKPIAGCNKVFGIDGKYQENQLVEAELSIGDDSFMTQLNVVNADQTVINLQNDFGFQLHGILGIPFLEENDCVIDFKNKLLIIGE